MEQITGLKTSDYYFDLPQELIAQDPLEDRASSRLLVMDKETGKIEHRVFSDIKVSDPETHWFSTIPK